MKERDVVAYLLRRVDATGGQYRKLAYEGRVGAPDYLVFYPIAVDHLVAFAPIACFVECKAPGKQPNVIQSRELKTLGSSGLHVAVVSTVEQADQLVGSLSSRRDETLKRIRRA